MTFTLYVEHETTDGEVVLESFEGVESFNNPPPTATLHISFADENRSDERRHHGTPVKANNE
jgi:hypothetical protein